MIQTRWPFSLSSMKTILVSTLLILIAFIQTACTTLGDKYKPTEVPKEKAQVVVYRPSRFMGSANSPYVCLDNKVVGEFPNGGYLVLEVEPGSHKIGQLQLFGDMNSVTTFNPKANEKYFLRYEVALLNGVSEHMKAGMAGGMAATPNVGVVGGAMSGAALAAFTPSKSEKHSIVSQADPRVHKEVANPGIFFVKEAFAMTEIQNVREYKVPKLSKKFCDEKTAKKE